MERFQLFLTQTQELEVLDAIEHNDIKKQQLSNGDSSPKSMLLFLYPSPAPVKAVLNYLGFAAGQPAYHSVPAPGRRC